MILLLLLSSLAFGEASTDTLSVSINDQISFANQGKAIFALQSGRPTITGVPSYKNGIKFSNTTGSALTFKDATTQNTAAVTSVFVGTYTINMAAYTPGNNGNTPDVCVPGSSVSWTSTVIGSTVAFEASAWQNSNGFPVMAVLIAGAEQKSVSGSQYRYMSNTATTYQMYKKWVIVGVSSGTINACLAYWYTTGNAGGWLNGGTYTNEFIATEIH